MTQIKHQTTPPAFDAALKAKVTFCVQGVISPLLANVYLHYGFDLWVHHWRHHSANGDVIVVRYADDSVVGFEHRQDALRFLDSLRDRLAKFGLSLNDEKSRVLEQFPIILVHSLRR